MSPTNRYISASSILTKSSYPLVCGTVSGLAFDKPKGSSPVKLPRDSQDRFINAKNRSNAETFGNSIDPSTLDQYCTRRRGSAANSVDEFDRTDDVDLQGTLRVLAVRRAVHRWSRSRPRRSHRIPIMSQHRRGSIHAGSPLPGHPAANVPISSSHEVQTRGIPLPGMVPSRSIHGNPMHGNPIHGFVNPLGPAGLVHSPPTHQSVLSGISHHSSIVHQGTS